MAESLSARVGRIIAGGLHASLDLIEDAAPEAMMEQSLREVDKVVAEVRHELGIVSANRHLAQQQHAELNRQHTLLAEQVEQAMGQSREDLARAGVARQLDIEAQLPVLEKSLANLAVKENELSGYTTALLAKRREMTTALENFRASRKAASDNGTSSSPLSGSEARMGSATSAFDRVYQRQTGLTPSAAGASIEQAAKLKELDDMVRNNQIEERLAKLKAAKS
jgi:phage shock protein A